MKYLIPSLFTLIIVTGVSGLLQAQVDFSADDMEESAGFRRNANEWKFDPVPGDIGSNYDVKWYRCWWNIDPAVFAISGNVTTLFVPSEQGVNSITFGLKQAMIVDSVLYHQEPINYQHNSDIVTINFSSALPAQTPDSVTVYYHGTPLNSFVKTIHQGVPIIMTTFNMNGGSDWWPCKGGLTDKADSIDIYLNTPNNYRTATAGRLVSEINDGSNTIYHWKHRYPIAAYVINIAVTNYSQYTQQVIYGGDTLDIINCVYPENLGSLIPQTALIIPAIQLFDSLFGMYPFQSEKYGMAQYVGTGMENQTMSFLGNFGYNLMVHELAHQWFGNKITCGSWSDVWLNEGFAVYVTTLCYEYFKPEDLKAIIRSFVDNVTSQPGGSVYCPNLSDPTRIFDDRLSYQKGCLLLHQLRWVIGDSAFFAGLRNYLNDPNLAYGFARTSDLKSHLEIASGQDLTWYFDDWFTGQGYPIYNVKIIQSQDYSTSVTINQSQSHNSVSFFEMPVPIRFYGAGKDTTMVFNNTFSGQVFTMNPGFAIDSTIFDPDIRLISRNNAISLGIDDISFGKDLILRPNPAGNILDIDHNPGNVKSLEVLDMQGRSVFIPLKKEDGSSIELNTQELKSGMYLLRIVYSEGIVTRKFIKE